MARMRILDIYLFTYHFLISLVLRVTFCNWFKGFMLLGKLLYYFLVTRKCRCSNSLPELNWKRWILTFCWYLDCICWSCCFCLTSASDWLPPKAKTNKQTTKNTHHEGETWMSSLNVSRQKLINIWWVDREFL